MRFELPPEKPEEQLSFEQKVFETQDTFRVLLRSIIDYEPDYLATTGKNALIEAGKWLTGYLTICSMIDEAFTPQVVAEILYEELHKSKVRTSKNETSGEVTISSQSSSGVSILTSADLKTYFSSDILKKAEAVELAVEKVGFLAKLIIEYRYPFAKNYLDLLCSLLAFLTDNLNSFQSD